MTPSLCPTCNAPIDPARAPVAQVRGARIVTFCSPACADGRSPRRERARTRVEPAEGAEREPAREQEPRARVDYTPVRQRGTRKRRIVALSVAIMAGGMIITIINAVSPSTPSDVSAADSGRRAAVINGSMGEGRDTPVERAVDPGDEPARAPQAALELEPEALLARARATLRELMSSPSERVQHIAALALARDGDPQALSHLRAAIEVEAAELRKIEIAYALARAGDHKAKKRLRRRLKHSQRDVRLDAARALVQLGDDTGNPVLHRMLSLPHHRIGAAGLLARMGDPAGVSALRKELTSSSATEESRMRAAVALGRAGDDSVRDRLVGMLEDRRYHVGAADALAVLEHEAAIPALTRQLELPSLRVRAALGLRRLGVSVDLAVLAAALESGSDPTRISAAEALLILTGPERLAELD